MEGLGINFKLLLAQVINFAIFFFLFQRFIAKPFLNFIHDEKQREKEKERIQEKLKKQEASLIQEEKEFREKIRKEADLLLRNTKEEAEKIKEEMLTQAKQESEEIKLKVRNQLNEEREQMYSEIKNKIINVSVMIVQNALKNYLTDHAKKGLTEYILRNLPKDRLKYEN